MSEPLPPGTRVEMTPHAIAMGLQGRSNRRTGVVRKARYHMPDGGITVLRDGIKRAERYDPSFWRAAP